MVEISKNPVMTPLKEGYGPIMALMDLIATEDAELPPNIPGFYRYACNESRFRYVISAPYEGQHYLYIHAPEHSCVSFSFPTLDEGPNTFHQTFSGTNDALFRIPVDQSLSCFSLQIPEKTREEVHVVFPVIPKTHWEGVAPLAKTVSHNLSW